MKRWRSELSSRKMLSYYTVPSSSQRTLHSCLPFYFLSDWPPNPNPEKEKMRKVSPYLIFPLLCTLYLIRLSALFFPNNQVKSNNTSNRFDFIVTLTSGKNLWPPSQKWSDDSTFRKTYATYVTYAKWALKAGSLLVKVRVLKVERLG